MEKIIKIRSNGTKSVATINSLPTKTQQQWKKECDVNEIIAKYKKTGTVTHVNNAKAGVYADLTELPSYQEAMNSIVIAQEAFTELPAKLRARFGNDPHQLIEFLKDPQNNEESITLGLRPKPQEPVVDPVLETLNQIKENTKK